VIRLAERGIRAVLLDIEGTTTPIAFVHERLFPYVRAKLRAFLDAHWLSPNLAEVRRQLAVERDADLGRDETPPQLRMANDERALTSLSAYVEWLMDRDRKSPGLKLLQGLIWEEGYRGGELHGLVFDDVPDAMRVWAARGVRVAIYSSGSELAQRLLFQSTEHGDLTPLIGAFFDTGVGGKKESKSYTRIAAALGCKTGEILFVSDVVAELDASREAGMQVALSVRPGNPEQEPRSYERVHALSDIAP
jgi:enolase-phosphatase E1